MSLTAVWQTPWVQKKQHSFPNMKQTRTVFVTTIWQLLVAHQNHNFSKSRQRKASKKKIFQHRRAFLCFSFYFLSTPPWNLVCERLISSQNPVYFGKNKLKVFEIFSVFTAAHNRASLVRAQFQYQTMSATHHKYVRLKQEPPLAAFRCGVWFWKSTFLQRKEFAAGSQLLAPLSLISQHSCV